jgi:hypothetical protein
MGYLDHLVMAIAPLGSPITAVRSSELAVLWLRTMNYLPQFLCGTWQTLNLKREPYSIAPIQTIPLASEVPTKMILMGHPVSSCHIPVVRSCFIFFQTLISSWKLCYVHLCLHVITPYIFHFSHQYIFRKRLYLSHFRIVLSQKVTIFKHVIIPYIVRFSHLYISKKRLILSHFGQYCPKSHFPSMW